MKYSHCAALLLMVLITAWEATIRLWMLATVSNGTVAEWLAGRALPRRLDPGLIAFTQIPCLVYPVDRLLNQHLENDSQTVGSSVECSAVQVAFLVRDKAPVRVRAIRGRCTREAVKDGLGSATPRHSVNCSTTRIGRSCEGAAQIGGADKLI